MLTRLRHVRRDERGMAFVYVGLGFMGFLAATTLAIDVGMFMTARSQAQNSADAGALAGATSLALNSFSDRSPGGPAVSSAVSTALANPVIKANVSVTPSDVTFPNTNGLNDLVKVDVYRTAHGLDALDYPVPVRDFIRYGRWVHEHLTVAAEPSQVTRLDLEVQDLKNRSLQLQGRLELQARREKTLETMALGPRAAGDREDGTA